MRWPRSCNPPPRGGVYHSVGSPAEGLWRRAGLPAVFAVTTSSPHSWTFTGPPQSPAGHLACALARPRRSKNPQVSSVGPWAWAVFGQKDPTRHSPLDDGDYKGRERLQGARWKYLLAAATAGARRRRKRRSAGTSTALWRFFGRGTRSCRSTGGLAAGARHGGPGSALLKERS
jgi:hypothetical protein